MLQELLVENYAVVERVRVRFGPGFNLLTGETGSGKSIVVDALALVFGGRASADMVRSGAERARVAAIFDAPPTLPEGVEAEDGELIVEREISATGKSRGFVNGRPVTTVVLRALADALGDIHGQHDQQTLFEEPTQRALLDSFGAIDTSKAAALHAQWRELQTELEELRRSEQERLRLADLWAFQRREIEETAPLPDEDEELQAERRMLSNVTKLSGLAQDAYDSLYDAPSSSLAGLRLAAKRLDEVVRIDPALEPALESIRSAEIQLNDAAHSLRDYLGKLEADPARLEWVEGRLAALDKLKRKYGSTLAAVISYLDEVTSSLQAADSAEERTKSLEKRLRTVAGEYEREAMRVTAARREAAANLESAVEQELQSLAMERTRLRVSLEAAPWSAHGADRVTFLVSPNPGEEPRPMNKVLSGGELSRLALALKCVSSLAPGGRTLVFDEVDAGIGGAVAEAVGRRLKRIAAANQVLCVTHLAQIAGFGDQHFVVAKSEHGGRTRAEVHALDHEARVREIGRMLAGSRLTPAALEHAAQLLTQN